MNQLIEQFILDFYDTDDYIGTKPQVVVERAESVGVDSIDSLVDFLLSENGYYNTTTFNAQKRRSFFRSNRQYSEIEKKLEQRKKEFIESMDKIRDDPAHNIFFSRLLSVNYRHMTVSASPNAPRITLDILSGEGYNDLDLAGKMPDDVPRYTINLLSQQGMQLKFFGQSPMLEIDGETVYFREYIHRTRRYLEKMGSRRLYATILDSSGSPILAYDYGNDLILDLPEFKGSKGKVFWAQNSHSTRAIFFIDKDDNVHEYKGARLDQLSRFLIGASLSPPGVCSIGAVETEAKAVEALSDVLPYRAKAIGLDYRVPTISVDNLEDTSYLDLGILKREGKLHQFAPYIRMSDLGFVPYASLLSDYNFDFTKSFRNLGSQLGTAHSRLIYPRFMSLGNADIYGNMIDLEGTVTNDRFWKLFSEWTSKNVLFSDGNPLIRSITVDYEFGSDFKPVPKVIQREKRPNEPKDWKELRDLINKYGIQIHELDSLTFTLESVIDLLSRFENNPVLKGKQNEFYNAFLDAYIEARSSAITRPLIEAYRIVPETLGWANNDELQAFILYGSIGYIKFKDMPYVYVPRDFQFVDRKSVELSSK